MKGALAFAFALLLCACNNNDQPIMLEPGSDLLGVWEYQFDEFGNGVNTDQFLLVFHQDSTVDYKRCKNSIGGYSYTKLPGLDILEVDPKRILLGSTLFFIPIRKQLDFKKFPYTENGDTFMVVNETRLRRLKPGEISNHQSWKCADDDKDEGI